MKKGCLVLLASCIIVGQTLAVCPTSDVVIDYFNQHPNTYGSEEIYLTVVSEKSGVGEGKDKSKKSSLLGSKKKNAQDAKSENGSVSSDQPFTVHAIFPADKSKPFSFLKSPRSISVREDRLLCIYAESGAPKYLIDQVEKSNVHDPKLKGLNKVVIVLQGH